MPGAIRDAAKSPLCSKKPANTRRQRIGGVRVWRNLISTANLLFELRVFTSVRRTLLSLVSFGSPYARTYRKLETIVVCVRNSRIELESP